MPAGDLPALRYRDACALLFDAGWLNVLNLHKMLSTIGAESDLFPHAWHWNDPSEVGVDNPAAGSTDWGITQQNDGNVGGGPPDTHGTPVFKPGQKLTQAQVLAFREVCWDPERCIVEKARPMYEARGFQPWAAATGAWKKKATVAAVGVCNFLAVRNGLPPIV